MALRITFERELQKLHDRLLALGAEVQSNIVEAVDVLNRRDAFRARRLIAGDLVVNQKRISIMMDALALIVTQQPMAGDMRLIASIIEISGELERINDYVKGIAKNSLMIGRQKMPPVQDDLRLMAEKAREMLRHSLAAVSQRDAELAQSVPDADDEIDELFNQIYREIMDFGLENPDLFESVNYLEWALHNLERAADRVTNICEWVIYQVTGVYAELDSEFEAPPPKKVE